MPARRNDPQYKMVDSGKGRTKTRVKVGTMDDPDYARFVNSLSDNQRKAMEQVGEPDPAVYSGNTRDRIARRAYMRDLNPATTAVKMSGDMMPTDIDAVGGGVRTGVGGLAAPTASAGGGRAPSATALSVSTAGNIRQRRRRTGAGLQTALNVKETIG